MPTTRVLGPLFVAISWLALPAMLVSTWLATVVTDPDSYVETVSPLADQPFVQSVIEERLTAEVSARAGSEVIAAELDQLLGGRSSVLAGALADVAERAALSTVAATSQRVIDSSQFKPAWERANLAAHGQLLSVLEGGDDNLVIDDGLVGVQLGGLVDSALSQIDERTGLDLAGAVNVDASLPLMSSDDLAVARLVYSALKHLEWALPLLWTLSTAGALLVARQRRTAAIWLSLGWAAGAALLAYSLGGLGEALASKTFEPRIVEAMWEVLSSTLSAGAWTVAGASGALALLLVALGFGSRTS